FSGPKYLVPSRPALEQVPDRPDGPKYQGSAWPVLIQISLIGSTHFVTSIVKTKAQLKFWKSTGISSE
ncbi:hypothetical protein PanWU01x14_140310, partial [Parasponia andersonii]